MTRPISFAVALSVYTLHAMDAHAFENQWHLGAGGGGLSYSGDSNYLVPALSLHGAYGVSDVFDVRMETALGESFSSTKSNGTLGLAELVLAYKIDIIEWIPWVGLGVGVFGATSALRGVGRDALQPASSLWVGMDYAFSRQWGLGGVFAVHSWPTDSSRADLRLAAIQFGLRVERRFGW